MAGFFLAIGQTLLVRLGLYCGEAKNAPPRAAEFCFMLVAANKPLTTWVNEHLLNLLDLRWRSLIARLKTVTPLRLAWD